jgi:hypothetical protein
VSRLSGGGDCVRTRTHLKQQRTYFGGVASLLAAATTASHTDEPKGFRTPLLSFNAYGTLCTLKYTCLEPAGLLWPLLCTPCFVYLSNIGIA